MATSNIPERDKKLGHLIHEGLDGKISLIGFPYAVGAGRDNLYKGQENGPDCLRRFLPRVGPIFNPEYDISLENLSVSDYGNIQVDGKELAYQQLIDKLQVKVKSALTKQNIPVVIGGSRDCAFSSISSLIQANNQCQTTIISIGAHLDMKRQYDGDKLSVSCVMRKTIEDNYPILQNTKSKFICFGVQDCLVLPEENKFVQSLPDIISVIPLNQIRRTQTLPSSSIFEPVTQAGQRFTQILLSAPENSQIHVSFALESIHSTYCPGVTRVSVGGGLTGEEATEIAFQAGWSKLVKGIDFTDFNPSNEDFRTGLLLANLVYYFSMGVAARQESKPII